MEKQSSRVPGSPGESVRNIAESARPTSAAETAGQSSFRRLAPIDRMAPRRRMAYARGRYGVGTTAWLLPPLERGATLMLALPDGRTFIGRTWSECFARADIHAEKVGGREGLARRAAEPAPSLEESASAVMAMIERAS